MIRKPFYGDFSRFEAKIGPDGKDYNHQIDCPQHANPETELPCMCCVGGTYPALPLPIEPD